MANISTLGNQIHINQNTTAIGNKFVSAHARLLAQDNINSERFEENNKRLKETRETEETGEIDEHLVDNGVYKVTPRYPKREQAKKEKRNQDLYIIDEKNRKIDIKI